MQHSNALAWSLHGAAGGGIQHTQSHKRTPQPRVHGACMVQLVVVYNTHTQSHKRTPQPRVHGACMVQLVVMARHWLPAVL